MMPDASPNAQAAKIMLIGADRKQILERRLQAAGCQVIKVKDGETAVDFVRHERFDTSVLISAGSMINIAETIFNLRDLNRSMEIIVLVESRAKNSDRFLRQLFEHPIAGTRILTRRQLQKQLPTTKPPPGHSF
jgi:hypothetical protein